MHHLIQKRTGADPSQENGIGSSVTLLKVQQEKLLLTAGGGLRKVSGLVENYKEAALVEFEATSKEPGAPLRAPTIEAGLAPACKDTCYGDLKLQMWEKRSDGSKGQMILDVTSDMAALEIGGGPWFNAWKSSSTSPQLLGQTLRPNKYHLHSVLRNKPSA